MAIKVHASFHVHPGPWLRDELITPHGLSVTQAARHLGVTRPAMSNLLNGKAGLSADMALRFERAFGISADTLMRMQSAYELAQAREHEGEIKVERFAEAA
ncbi:transcriptional regulator [Novosphingobium endophyticum]|uniref:Transcriptional regulator n=1 Tax=Novosphingobium endophyticum TaxID=1955250 RepID=A0A916TVD6_9SPHN|nr:HigA family addiction module antitoxin [Novosphingobium endophyticum]GGC14984.1 transcriptional regulator [Novosphingobium endophyticum]